VKGPGQLSLWRLLSVLHPPWDQSPGRRMRSKSSSGPWAALSSGPDVLPFPAGHWAEAEGAQQAMAGAALQREAKAFPTDEQRGRLKGGGHKPGKEGTGSFLVTCETQQANTPAPCSSSALVPSHLAQTPGSKPANPSLPFGVRRKNLEPKGVATASSGTWWVQGHEAAITEG